MIRKMPGVSLRSRRPPGRVAGWFSVDRLDGVTHFPALEIPDATAAEIENFLG